MDFAGQYASPLLRHQELHIPVVSSGTATVTGRLKAQSIGSNYGNSLSVVVTNEGNTAFSIQFQETGSLSGTRTDLNGTISLVPRGSVVGTLTPTKEILEVKGMTGSGTARISIEGLVQWDVQAFSKADALYPTYLWLANNIAPQSSLNVGDAANFAPN